MNWEKGCMPYTINSGRFFSGIDAVAATIVKITVLSFLWLLLKILSICGTGKFVRFPHTNL